MENFGTLSILVTTAGGAYPLADASVLIQGVSEENAEVRYSLLTDRNGRIPQLTLPATKRENSMSPQGNEAAFSAYDITVTKDGYLRKKIHAASVFAGINAFLPIQMIPTALYDKNTVYAEGTTDLVIRQNEML